jgi:hypothetical protein
MGTYTNFTLSVEGSGPVYDKLMANQDDVIFSDYDISIGEWLKRSCDRNLKWYDHDKDMVQLSKEWPNVLFILEGQVENGGSIWKAWYRNGKMHKLDAKIVFETIKPDLDTLLPIDHTLEERLAKQYKDEIKEKIAALKKQLDELESGE